MAVEVEAQVEPSPVLKNKRGRGLEVTREKTPLAGFWDKRRAFIW